MKPTRRFIYGIWWICLGASLLITATLVPNSGFEKLLLGKADGSLLWGPTLFRVLLAGHGLAMIFAGIRTHLLSRKRSHGASDAVVDETKRATPRTDTATWVALAALTVIGLLLRLWNVNSDLWYDEVLSLLDYFRPPVGQILTSFSSQNQHMLYSILAHTSIQVFGETAAAVRLPSVLFGVASIWPIFFLGRRLIGKTESLLACSLTTVSYHHIWFSQNARGYMGLLFFSVLATWLYLRALKQNSWGIWITYAFAVALGMWLHMTMAFVVAAHGLIYVGSFLVQLVRKANAKQIITPSLKPFFAWALCVSLSLQMHAFALPQFLATALHLPSPPSEWSSLWWVLIESLRSLQIGFSGSVVVAFGLALMAAGFIAILRRDPLAAWAMVLPAVIGGIAMLVMDHYLWPRFFFFSMGFGILIAVRGASVLSSLLVSVMRAPLIQGLIPSAIQLRLTHSGGALLACLLIAGSVLTLHKLYALPKQDFTGARNWLEKSRTPGDAVVAVGLAGVAYGRYYEPSWSVAQTKAELDFVRNRHTNVWLVYILPPQLKVNRTDIWNTIQKEFETVEVFPGTLGGGGVYVCRQRDASQSLPPKNQQALTSVNRSMQ